MITRNPFTGKAAAATVNLAGCTRGGIRAKLHPLGAKPASSVSKGTDCPIVGEKTGSKLGKAMPLGVATPTEAEFEAMLASDGQSHAVPGETSKAPDGEKKEAAINGIQIDPEKLWPMAQVLRRLEEDGADDSALSKIRGAYSELFGSELAWCFPISVGAALGSHIIAVREGFLNLPYSAVETERLEIFDLDDAKMLDADAIQLMIYLWERFSAELSPALDGIQRILRG
jgi:hypothetical protein